MHREIDRFALQQNRGFLACMHSACLFFRASNSCSVDIFSAPRWLYSTLPHISIAHGTGETPIPIHDEQWTVTVSGARVFPTASSEQRCRARPSDRPTRCSRKASRIGLALTPFPLFLPRAPAFPYSLLRPASKAPSHARRIYAFPHPALQLLAFTSRFV